VPADNYGSDSTSSSVDDVYGGVSETPTSSAAVGGMPTPPVAAQAQTTSMSASTPPVDAAPPTGDGIDSGFVPNSGAGTLALRLGFVALAGLVATLI
jgi:hypothetical protein